MSYSPDHTSSRSPQKPVFEFQEVAQRLRRRPCKNSLEALETQILLSLIDEAPPAEMERLLQQWRQRKRLTVIS
ncbi:hypothetical protein [Acidithiobacillus thiooxidans]|jgi:hypothetical protein|uniref:Uncharacterized protein n=1 Tax=Acidithiobacillus thiooxidans TaxID=930 RepID=A0A1C2I9E5_ACITH|nr:hypothetical protein [Acidithiobacillus thiooxidans]OCX72616.1 hypothetical protein A6M23_09575 [Acidithiobacillus thiooxidans]OCX85020.1 hypothetical protein A6P08_08365 [Acidithiobacillus thiooxidans]